MDRAATVQFTKSLTRQLRESVRGYRRTARCPDASRKIRSPVLRMRVAFLTLARAGNPYSRAIVDACDSIPPTSTITPDASVKSGVHDGSVAVVTRIAPRFMVA